jgi:hypothetical protein
MSGEGRDPVERVCVQGTSEAGSGGGLRECVGCDGGG